MKHREMFHLHRHHFVDLGFYYHLYDHSGNGFFIGDMPMKIGIHVEVNHLLVCDRCGKTQVVMVFDKLVADGADSAEFSDYIAFLRSKDIIDENSMEKQLADRLQYFKIMKRFD